MPILILVGFNVGWLPVCIWMIWVLISMTFDFNVLLDFDVDFDSN